VADCLGFIEKCANDYDYDDIIIFGDLSFEIKSNNSGYVMFKSLYDDLASLDASQAFDCEIHIKSFKRLIDKGLPSLHVIKILINWCGKIFCTVK